MGIITGKLLVIFFVITGIYLLLTSQSLTGYNNAFRGSHLPEIVLGLIGGLITIFLVYIKPQRKAGK